MSGAMETGRPTVTSGGARAEDGAGGANLTSDYRAMGAESQGAVRLEPAELARLRKLDADELAAEGDYYRGELAFFADTPPDQDWVMDGWRNLVTAIDREIRRREPGQVAGNTRPDLSEVIRAVKERVSLVDELAGRGYELRKNGSGHVGLCPFHSEKTPSFHVKANGYYRCFGCEVHGDIITFIMDKDKLDFIPALRYLANLGAVPWPAPRPQVQSSTPAALPIAQQLNALPLTDAGQAEAIALLHGDKLRYDHSRKRWLRWDGSRWALDVDGHAHRLALDTARQRLKASADIADSDAHKAAARWALQAEGAYRIKAALEMAGTLAHFAVTSDKLDRDPWALVCTNGTVDLRTGELRQGRPEDLNTLSTGIAFDEAAACPRWLTFMDEVTCGDIELAENLQRAFGYSLTGDTREQVFFPMHGTGANGKTIYQAAMRLTAGDYATNTSFDTFVTDPHGSRQIPNDVAALRGARLVTASEVAEGKRLNEGRIKALTGEEPITARFLNAEFFTFQPTFKIWLGLNHRPEIKETGEAIWRRVRLIPFNAHFGPDTADPLLLEKLKAELPGILAWAVRGCLDWLKHGLGTAPAVTAATESYRVDSDQLATFLAECTETAPSETVAAATLYARYKAWTVANGEKAETGTAFGRHLKERGVNKLHDRAGWRYIGLRLLPVCDECDEL